MLILNLIVQHWYFFRVSENMPLYDILNEFQKGHSHIAVVYKDLNETKDMPVNDKGSKT